MDNGEEATVRIPRKLEVTLIHEYRVESKTRELIKELLPQVMNEIKKIIEDSEKAKVCVRTPPPAGMSPIPPSARPIIDVPEVEDYLVKEAGITMEELATYQKISKAVKKFLTKKMEEESKK